MQQYLDLVQRVLKEGVRKENRTGVDTLAIPGAIFEHDMSDGFPLLTTKTIPFRLVSSELEFFINGITDKKWLTDRNNHIWDEWANPKKVSYVQITNEMREVIKKITGEPIVRNESLVELYNAVSKTPDVLEAYADKEMSQKLFSLFKSRKEAMDERDLGPVYGFQWRHFDTPYEGYEEEYAGRGVDQLGKMVDSLHNNPNDRRMLVSAWNPKQMSQMGLPPCHYGYQVTVIGDKLNLMWNQRSVDTMLGLPFNIASYGLLLHLLAKESGFDEGKLVGFLGDVHIYENHLEGAEKQLSRTPHNLAEIETSPFTSIFDWHYQDSKILDYKHEPTIKFDIAV